uniref:Uncharacterized protein n=1 Tax=Arundo donax TaxID=35708 RepID=A0A0A9UC79_ARUDO
MTHTLLPPAAAGASTDPGHMLSSPSSLLYLGSVGIGCPRKPEEGSPATKVV